MKKWLLTIALLLTSSIANSAILQVDGFSGELIGARGVDVGGTLYDVQFLDGECASLVIGCDGIGDFVFDNATTANAASSALLDQVFLDLAGGGGQYLSNPGLTRGCNPEWCDIITPYALGAVYSGGLQEVAVSMAEIYSYDYSTGGSGPSKRIGMNVIFSTMVPGSSSSTGYDNGGGTLAVWTSRSVTEPSTMALMGLGLIGLGFARR